MIYKAILMIIVCATLSCDQITTLNISAAGNFTVATPKMVAPVHIENVFNGSLGGMSFHDDFGQLLAIYYTPIPVDATLNKDQKKFSITSLKSWFKQFVMPTFFLPISKNTKIIQEKEIAIEGEPAYFLTIEIPGGSIMQMLEIKEHSDFENWREKASRIDAKRNILVLARGKYFYAISEEITPILPSESSLNQPEFSLVKFYETINFN